MTLGEKQRAFALMIGKLILFAYEKGYELTFGESFNAKGEGHMKGSTHYIRLAMDLNLFKNNAWLANGQPMEEGHGMLHDYWDSLGGAKRIDKDLNHYSMEWEGRR